MKLELVLVSVSEWEAEEAVLGTLWPPQGRPLFLKFSTKDCHCVSLFKRNFVLCYAVKLFIYFALAFLKNNNNNNIV